MTQGGLLGTNGRHVRVASRFPARSGRGRRPRWPLRSQLLYFAALQAAYARISMVSITDDVEYARWSVGDHLALTLACREPTGSIQLRRTYLRHRVAVVPRTGRFSGFLRVGIVTTASRAPRYRHEGRGSPRAFRALSLAWRATLAAHHSADWPRPLLGITSWPSGPARRRCALKVFTGT